MTNSTDASTTWKSPPSEPVVSDGESADLLTGAVQPVSTLSPDERERMFQLLVENFQNTTRHGFETDLAEKEWVILLRGKESGTIQGFSTLMQLDTEMNEERVTAFFSGDTIIQRDFWGQTVLPRLWSRHVFRLAAALGDRKVFWFLICSGYKTYRFLPVFFREFYPRYDRPTPPEAKALMDLLAYGKYGREYDAAAGVVRFDRPAPLKGGIADISPRRLQDPDVAFFASTNPGHARGDELVCITRISPDNVTPAGRRMLGTEAADR